MPAAAQAVATSAPDHVVGTATPASCSSDAVVAAHAAVAAVADNGVTTFNCRPDPVTMTMTAKVFNDKPNVVLDGGGKVTWSGGGALRLARHDAHDGAEPRAR